MKCEDVREVGLRCENHVIWPSSSVAEGLRSRVYLNKHASVVATSRPDFETSFCYNTSSRLSTTSIMSAEDEQSQSGYEDGLAGGPGAPTPLSALEGVAGLTKRDIQLFVDGGFNTVESIAYT